MLEMGWFMRIWATIGKVGALYRESSEIKRELVLGVCNLCTRLFLLISKGNLSGKKCTVVKSVVDPRPSLVPALWFNGPAVVVLSRLSLSQIY